MNNEIETCTSKTGKKKFGWFGKKASDLKAKKKKLTRKFSNVIRKYIFDCSKTHRIGIIMFFLKLTLISVKNHKNL